MELEDSCREIRKARGAGSQGARRERRVRLAMLDASDQWTSEERNDERNENHNLLIKSIVAKE